MEIYIPLHPISKNQDILIINALQGRVKFPIGGIVRKPIGRTVATTVPTVIVWMKEKQMKKTTIALGILMSTTAVYAGGIDGKALHEGGNAFPITESVADTTITLQEVSIRSHFSDEKETPLSITTISPQDIRLHATAPNYVEMMQGVPGVYATASTGSYGDASLNMRGFKQDNIAILLNGIPIQGLTSGSMYWSNWMGLSDATYAVQIQKGMGSSMLADCAMGGMVNIITRTGNGHPTGAFALSTTQHGLTKGTLTYSTGTLAHGWSVDMMLAYTRGHSFVEVSDVNTMSYMLTVSKYLGQHNTIMFTALGSPEEHDQRNTELSKEEVDKYGVDYSKNWGYLRGERYSIARNHYWKPYFTLQHILDGERFNMKNSIYMALANGGGRSTASSSKTSIIAHQTADGHIDFDAVLAENRAAKDADGKYIGQHAMIDYLSGHTQAGAIASGSYRLTDATTIEAGLQYQYYDTYSKMVMLDLLGSDYLLYYGKKYFLDDYVGSRYGRTTHHFSAFAQGKWTIGRLNANLGATIFNGNYRRHNDETGEKSVWASGTGASVKAGFLYHLTQSQQGKQGTSAFLNLGYNSRLPYAGTYLASSDLSITNDVTNEENIMGELGLRSSWTGGGLELSGYIASWRNKTLTVSLSKRANEAAEKYQITGLNALHMGLELNVHQQLTPWLRLKAYAMTASWKWKSSGNALIYDSYSGETLKEYTIYCDGLHVGDAPQTQLGAQLHFSKALNNRKAGSLYAHLGWQYNARMYADFEPSSRTTDSKDDAYKLPAYSLFDATVGWEGILSRALRLNLFVTGQNILNAEYIERGIDGATHDLTSFRGYWGAPRLVSFGMRLTF